MKKYVAILLSWLIIGCLFAQDISIRCSDKFKQHEFSDKRGYDLCYVEDIEAAEYVVWTLTDEDVRALNVPRENVFYLDTSISTLSADPSDYAKTGFDRGHMCPNDDRNFSVKAMKETFYMSNMSPQTPTLNRQTWRASEALGQRLAEDFGHIDIVCGPIFTNGYAELYIGKTTKVRVPDAFYKIYYSKEADFTLAYIIPQDCKSISPGSNDTSETLMNKLKSFKVKVPEIEQKTGLKFSFKK